jgi:Carboxypeptidase regulatory-like domain
MNATVRTLRGTVLDEAGQPVAQARVYFVEAPGPVPDVAALTGVDGRFELAAGPAGAYEVACSTDTQGSARVRVELGSGGAAAEVRLIVRRASPPSHHATRSTR